MKTFKITVLVVLFLVTREISYAQQQALSLTVEELTSQMIKQPRPVIFYIYTSWCSYCKIQDQQIKKDSSLQNLLKTNFYFIRFNAENKNRVDFNGKTYHFKSHGISGGTHELAFLGQKPKEQLTYPLWIIFDRDYKLLHRYSGLVNTDELNMLLNFIITNN
jgi:thioredoxin-related protein